MITIHSVAPALSAVCIFTSAARRVVCRAGLGLALHIALTARAGLAPAQILLSTWTSLTARASFSAHIACAAVTICIARTTHVAVVQIRIASSACTALNTCASHSVCRACVAIIIGIARTACFAFAACVTLSARTVFSNLHVTLTIRGGLSCTGTCTNVQVVGRAGRHLAPSHLYPCRLLARKLVRSCITRGGHVLTCGWLLRCGKIRRACFHDFHVMNYGTRHPVAVGLQCHPAFALVDGADT